MAGGCQAYYHLVGLAKYNIHVQKCALSYVCIHINYDYDCSLEPTIRYFEIVMVSVQKLR